MSPPSNNFFLYSSYHRKQGKYKYIPRFIPSFPKKSENSIGKKKFFLTGNAKARTVPLPE